MSSDVPASQSPSSNACPILQSDAIPFPQGDYVSNVPVLPQLLNLEALAASSRDATPLGLEDQPLPSGVTTHPNYDDYSASAALPQPGLPVAQATITASQAFTNEGLSRLPDLSSMLNEDGNNTALIDLEHSFFPQAGLMAVTGLTGSVARAPLSLPSSSNFYGDHSSGVYYGSTAEGIWQDVPSGVGFDDDDRFNNMHFNPDLLPADSNIVVCESGKASIGSELLFALSELGERS